MVHYLSRSWFYVYCSYASMRNIILKQIIKWKVVQNKNKINAKV